MRSPAASHGESGLDASQHAFGQKTWFRALDNRAFHESLNQDIPFHYLKEQRMTTDKDKPGESITVEPLHEIARYPIWFEKFRRAVFIGFILVLGVSALTLVLSLPVIYFVDEHQKVRTESVEPAGKVISITLADGFFTRALEDSPCAWADACGRTNMAAAPCRP
jgi:hypothetical protein